jgi:hypothetical protein
MSQEPPPWARPREDSERLFVSRRVPELGPKPEHPAGPPAAVVGPPPAPKQAAPKPPAPIRQDTLIGLITSPMSYTDVAAAHRPGIGVVAVAMSATIALVAIVATAIAGRAGAGLLLIGSAVPLACLVVVALADRLALRSGMGSECRFVVRAETGESVAWTLHGAARAAAPRTGDLVRIVPGGKGKARAVEVLAGPDGPVVRRITGKSLLAPVQWAGLALAVVLVALTAAVLHGAF